MNSQISGGEMQGEGAGGACDAFPSERWVIGQTVEKMSNLTPKLVELS